MILRGSFLILATAIGLNFLFAGDNAYAENTAGNLGKTVEVPVAQQDWQVRRKNTADTLVAFAKGGSSASAAARQLDAILTEYEKNPFSITPMETMDLLLAFYFPREGIIESSIVMMAMTATLGWYDTLRFASASGRAEIINNEKFFIRALLNVKLREQYLMALKERRPWIEAAIEKGIEMADKAKDLPSRESKWPTGYGLERLMCAMENAKTCTTPTAMPQSEWPKAFMDSKNSVRAYYLPATK